VVLPDGRLVRGRGLRRPLLNRTEPTFGVYLLARDPGPFPWEHRWIRWPDFRTPSDRAAAIAVLREAYERAASERVEVACHGGVGRTGTALAALAVIGGIAPADAVPWVRDRYDPKAVEMPWQRRWVERLPIRTG
jgi:protein-tyrosine phosphatase